MVMTRNLLLTLAVSGLLLGFASCGPSSSRGYVPVLPKPVRPTMQVLEPADLVEVKKMDPKTTAKIQGNFESLMIYSRQLEIGVDAYNGYARFNNALVDKALGKKEEPVKHEEEK